jgi:hypothetical protein
VIDGRAGVSFHQLRTCPLLGLGQQRALYRQGRLAPGAASVQPQSCMLRVVAARGWGEHLLGVLPENSGRFRGAPIIP